MQISSINKWAGNISEKAVSSKWLNKKFDISLNEPAKFAAAMLVTSIVSKDLVGCFLYTSQSLNNKKIPEEKRKFVAAVDLMNGIIMVGGQFLIGKIIDAKVTPKLLGKHYTGTFKDKYSGKETPINPNAILSDDKIYGDYLNILDKNKDELKTLGMDVKKMDENSIKKIGEEIVAKVGKNSKQGKAIAVGFGILISALATTALTKRAVAPLLSTPLAGWFKGNFMDKKDNFPLPEPISNKISYQPKAINPVGTKIASK